jgi:Uma2 family endonuclease
MTLGEKLYTWEEFEAYAESHPDALLELIDGRIVEKVTNEKHGKISINIGAELRAWAKLKKIKGHYGVDNSYRIPSDEHNERRPDVSFRFTDEEAKEKIAETLPDFCVEIKSLTNSYDELREKARFYVAHGARLVWLVYPSRRIVEVYFADGSNELFSIEDTLEGGDVLPDFSMTVADIFEI